MGFAMDYTQLASACADQIPM